MISWLLVIILAYLFFGLGSFFDKLVLAGTARWAPRPNSYTFYAGVAGLGVLIFLPFVKFGLPTATGFTWIILDALVRIAGLYLMYTAIEKFEVSKVVATIGAAQPIFIFILTSLFWGAQMMPVIDMIAFLLLFLGTVIISIEKTHKLTGDFLKLTILASALFSLDYVFAKHVFLSQSFLPGIIWMGLFIFLFALLFLIPKKSRQEIFAKRMILNKKTQTSFLLAQATGNLANFLQGFAIFLAPVIMLPVVNSLRGIQYIFLFLITLFFSYFFPKILKEGMSKKVVLQKIVSIAIIGVGLAILVLF